jgi:hypothetical protein
MTVNTVARPDVDRILATLKDFQRDTVDYVFERLYLDKEPVSRFLIADEVGLGKTLVARGVIAKAIDYLWKDTERIDVVYICSNLDIAQQNIDRLNITADRKFQFASRATLIPTTIQHLKGNKLNFISLTPGTSFNLRSSSGRAEERIVLYFMLRDIWRMDDRKSRGVLRNVLRGGKLKSNWNYDLKWFQRNKTIDATMTKAFKRELKKHHQLRADYESIASEMGSRRTRISAEVSWKRNEFISGLRRILARASLAELEPDLIIMDEFQRFKNVLDETDEMSVLARELFDFQDTTTKRQAKVLLLSATPYKMYTIHGEQGEDHYRDFLNTAKFLLGPLPGKLDELEAAVGGFRKSFFNLATGGKNREALLDVKGTIEDILRQVMVRTERLAVSTDRSGMLEERRSASDKLAPQDLVAFVHLDNIARKLQVEDQVEYWKSSAYPLNIMEGYKLKKNFRKMIQNKDGHLYEYLRDADAFFLHWNTFREYQELDPNNARLRALRDETLATGNWKLLWMPPSLPYYRPSVGSVYDGVTSGAGATKTLIFSSWRIVPKAISVLLSYDAERLMIGEKRNDFEYDELTTKRSALLRFAKQRDRLTGMPIFCLIYPCMTLAKELDPLAFSKEAGKRGRDSSFVTKEAKKKIAELLNQVSSNVEYEPGGRTDERWYWVALVLLDRHFHRDNLDAWLNTEQKGLIWSQMLRPGPEEDHESWFAEHVREFEEYFRSEIISLGQKPDDLNEVLAKVALAGPAVSTLRALTKVTQAADASPHVLASSAQVGLGFRKLFNQPDTITLMQNLFPSEDHWKAVIHYCLDGNLQAVLDEYTHVLNESLGVFGHDPDQSVSKIGEKIQEALSLNAQRNSFDEVVFDDNSKTVLPFELRRIRCRYAVRFGSERQQEFDWSTPDSKIRDAFNSPFRPFVLASTSIGQEGLDFHQYCHRIVHWNLPSNPVDLEQREGRIHRYKGHVIRRNIADEYGLGSIFESSSENDDPWKHLFSLASSDRQEGENELVPYWIFNRGKHRIERHVPILPLSREVGKLKQLKDSLVVYRSVIGQPRQEELLQYLQENLSADEIKAIMEDVVINLSPPSSTAAAKS